MHILIIRHGETDLNAARVIQHPDTPLSTRGLEQAERLGRHLASRNIDLVLASDYSRAHATAKQVSEHTGAPLEINTELRERSFGDLRGTAYADLGDIDFTADGYEPPNGESWEVFHCRVDKAWGAVVETAGRLENDLVVVTHGLVVSSLIERVIDASAHSPGPKFMVANTSFTVVEPKAPWRVLELASVAHLPEQHAGGGVV